MQGVPETIVRRQIALFAKCDPAYGAGVARALKLDAPGDWGYLAAAVALLCIVLQVVWLTRRPDRVDSGNIRPLRPERRGAA